MDYIAEDACKILLRKTPRTSSLYLLPKIHKKDIPGRSIINSISTLTETMSALMDVILRKYSVLGQSYIKDTSHFLQVISKLKITPGEILATVDVTALYRNTPHQDGIEKVTNFMRKNGATQQELELVEHLLQHILKKNYFQFNNQSSLPTNLWNSYGDMLPAQLRHNFHGRIRGQMFRQNNTKAINLAVVHR